MANSMPFGRVTAIDAYRGFVMFLMLAEVLHLGTMAKKKFPESQFWAFLAHHQEHVEWQGCSLHDLIQPSFSFLVGVALPYSIASRIIRQQSRGQMLRHAAFRSLLLIFLGIFLRSVDERHGRTNWTFDDTLTQIGMGYFFLFLVGLAKPAWRWVALVLILVGYWAIFAAYPAPGPDYDFASVGVGADWKHHPTGFAAHWDKNSNAAAAFDRFWMNLFSRPNPFEFSGGGYCTLSFIPTLGTMILGLIAGTWIKEKNPGWDAVQRLVWFGAIIFVLGYALDRSGVCPNVKRIWTPSWVLFSGGWCCLLLALFTATTDAIQVTEWSYPLRVIGANSIVAYCMSWLIEGFVANSLKKHFGATIFQTFGENYEPIVSGGAVLAVFWLILFWMYRNKLFVRI
jgi:heparan-alpha-glucosaminide N-acetyltransferase